MDRWTFTSVQIHRVPARTGSPQFPESRSGSVRVYGPEQPFFDQSWKPGDIEKINVAPAATTSAARAQNSPQVPYTVRAFTPAHGDLARSGGIPAQLANEEYVEALAHIVYYWGYPAIDVMTRTGQWETLKQVRARCLVSSPAVR